MTQISKQKAGNKVEKDFFKLLNSSSFGYDCKNNLSNCVFEPIFDEMDEITYLKKYNKTFDKSISSFVNLELYENEVERNFNEKLLNHKDDKFRESKINSAKIKEENPRRCRTTREAR